MSENQTARRQWPRACKLCGQLPKKEVPPSEDVTCMQAHAMAKTAEIEWLMMEAALASGEIEKFRASISQQYKDRYQLIWQKVS